MKKIYLLVFISTFSFYFSSAQYTWTKKASCPGGGMIFPAAFSIGAKGYVGTGLDDAAILHKDFWEFDTLTNAWTQKADYGGAARFSAAAFSIGNYGYIGLGTTYYDGGYNYIWSTDFWKYDPTSNTWTQLGNFPGHGRYAVATFTIGNKGYMGTGWDGGDFNDFWEYDPGTDTWTQKANFGGSAREGATGFALNNKGYITTGYDGTQENDLWEYDTLLNTWTQKANLPGTARDNANSFALCNYGYVGLGSVSFPYETEVKDFWRYDPSVNSWTQIANFQGTPREQAVVFVIGNIAYIGEGDTTNSPSSGFTNDFWQLSSDSCLAVAAPPPVASFQSADTVLCANDCITYTDKSTNATSWQWSFAGATPSSSTDQNPQSVCYFVSGNYNVSLIASNSGGSDTLNLVNYITVHPAPVTPNIIRSNDTLYCSTNSSYRSYQWYFNSVLVPGATNVFYIETQSGNYNVAVTDTNGCQISVGVILSGLNELNENSSFTIYPNPATNQLTIHTAGQSFNRATVSIMNVLGQETSPPTSLTPALSKGEGDAIINISALPAGMYFLQLHPVGYLSNGIKGEGGSVVKKFVKE